MCIDLEMHQEMGCGLWGTRNYNDQMLENPTNFDDAAVVRTTSTRVSSSGDRSQLYEALIPCFFPSLPLYNTSLTRSFTQNSI